MQPSVSWLIPLTLCCSLCCSLFASEPDQQALTITSLEYRERNTSKPYLVEGRTSEPQSLNYKLICKRGAAWLKVGRQYKVTERTDEDGIKVLFISLNVKEDPTLIGLECEVQSARIGRK
jgi:hypothetical protein